MSGVLRITDGTTTVNLLSPGITGLHLTEWKPAVAPFKNDGVWSDPPLRDGRQLAHYQYANAVETLRFTLVARSQDRAATTLQRLHLLAHRAHQYWTTRRGDPVYLEARSPCETNTRYAIVKAMRLVELENPYGPAFNERLPLMPELTLVIERGHWLETPPGQGVPIEISNPGHEATSQAYEVFVSNYNVIGADIAYIYIDDGGTFSDNLAGETDFALFPADPEIGDAIYFGGIEVDSTPVPFRNLIFDLATGQQGLTIVWEYYNGSAWQNIPDLRDNTSGLGTTGVTGVHWDILADWSACSVNASPVVYFVRARISDVEETYAVPEQQNRAVYSATWAYADIAMDQATGDIPALLSIVLRDEAGDYSGYCRFVSAIYASTRSLSRGENFSAYINVAGVGNPEGLTCSYEGFISEQSVYAPAGKWLKMVSGDPFHFISLEFDSTLAWQYCGCYRVFARVFIDSETFTITFLGRISLNLSGAVYSTEVINQTIESPFAKYILVDLGILEIPPPIYSDTYSPMTLYALLSGDKVFWFSDLILMPVDEVFISIQGMSSLWDAFPASPEYQQIGISALHPRESLILYRRPYSNEFIQPIRPANGVPPSCPIGDGLRLWFVFEQECVIWDTLDVIYHPSPVVTNSLQVHRQARYLSLRGAE